MPGFGDNVVGRYQQTMTLFHEPDHERLEELEEMDTDELVSKIDEVEDEIAELEELRDEANYVLSLRYLKDDPTNEGALMSDMRGDMLARLENEDEGVQRDTLYLDVALAYKDSDAVPLPDLEIERLAEKVAESLEMRGEIYSHGTPAVVKRT